jgi:hypothetical protein
MDLMQLSPEYVQLKATIQKVTKSLYRLEKQQNQLLDQLDELKKTCTHEEMILAQDYYPGSYYERAETVYWNKCVCCGYEEKTKTVAHSYYG